MPKLDGKQVKNLTIDTEQLAALAVTEAKIAASAVTAGKIATAVAGSGLTGGGGSPLAVGATGASGLTVTADDVRINDDDSTLEVSGTGPGTLQVKDLGITTGKIALLAVDTAQLAANAVEPGKANLATPWSFTAANLQTSTAPSADNEVANKAYVDAIAQGLSIKKACRLATAASLAPFTTSGGAGPGHRLTETGNGALTVDSVLAANGDRILVKDEPGSGTPGQYDHGIYVVIDLGSAGTPWILERATDFDGTPAGEVHDGCFTFIGEGTANAGAGWVLTTNDPITIDSTDLTFEQFSQAGIYTGGDGIDVAGTVISADLKASGGLKIDATEIMVEPADFAGTGLEDDGSDNMQLATQGNGITGGGGSTLSVLADPTEPSVKVVAAGVQAAVPYIGTIANQTRYSAPAVCVTDNDPTGIDLAVTPANPSDIRVLVNGIDADVGDNVGTQECYFATAAAPTTPIAISAVVATDILVWNALIAGYDLGATDRVALRYNYIA